MVLNIIQTIKDSIATYRKRIRYSSPKIVSEPLKETIPLIHTYSIYNKYSYSIAKKHSEILPIFNEDYPPKISTDEYNTLLGQLFSEKNIYSLNKALVLLKIHEDCLNIHSALIPLISAGIRYSIDLVGGAPRDFLLNNHDSIKDLDLLVRLDEPYDEQNGFCKNLLASYNRKESLIKNKWCTLEELEQVQFADCEMLGMQHAKLAQLCLNRAKYQTSADIFSDEQRGVSHTSYGINILNELGAIIKVKSDKLNYPVEILVTDRHKENFIQAIDFNICNVGISLISMHKYESVPIVSYKDIRERFYASREFFEDIHNKTITFNTHGKVKEQIEYSFTNHLTRIIEKYPSYKIVLTDNYVSYDIKKIIDTYMLTHELGTTLMTPKIDQLPKRKNKI